MKTLITLLLLLVTINVNAANKVSQSPMPRTESVDQDKQRSHSQFGVWLHQVDTTLYQDLDQDGFYQNLRLGFDLDTSFEHRDVFVEVWLSAPGGRHQLIYASDNIHLTGDSSLDAQQIEIQFIDDYQENYYQLELVVVDTATSLIVFTVDQFDDIQLQDLALEGQGSDQYQSISVYSATIDLHQDNNHNGLYHQLSVSFDIDVPYGSTELIAEFYLDDQLLFTGEPFWITGSQTSDKQHFDIELQGGLASGYYDLDIHLLDAADFRQRHHISALDWIVFNDLPLESIFIDSSNDHDIDVHVEQSGGSLGWGIAGLLLLMSGRRVDN